VAAGSATSEQSVLVGIKSQDEKGSRVSIS